MKTLLADPLQLWRDGLSRLEAELNKHAGAQLKTKGVASALHRLTTASLGMQQAAEALRADWYHRVDLPTRKDLAALEDTLRRIEDKLDRLLPEAATPAPRPARTRRPPQAESAGPAPGRGRRRK